MAVLRTDSLKEAKDVEKKSMDCSSNYRLAVMYKWINIKTIEAIWHN